MSARCTAPIPWESLVDYWAGDTDAKETDRIDEHLMGCDACTRVSAGISAVRATIHASIPLFVTRAQLEALRARGLRFVENPSVPGARSTAVFRSDLDLLINRLEGLDLTRAVSARVTVAIEGADYLLLDEPRVPFDPDSGVILVTCQRHFGAFPRNVVFEVHTKNAAGDERVERYVVPHVFEEVP